MKDDFEDEATGPGYSTVATALRSVGLPLALAGIAGAIASRDGQGVRGAVGYLSGHLSGVQQATQIAHQRRLEEMRAKLEERQLEVQETGQQIQLGAGRLNAIRNMGLPPAAQEALLRDEVTSGNPLLAKMRLEDVRVEDPRELAIIDNLTNMWMQRLTSRNPLDQIAAADFLLQNGDSLRLPDAIRPSLEGLKSAAESGDAESQAAAQAGIDMLKTLGVDLNGKFSPRTLEAALNNPLVMSSIEAAVKQADPLYRAQVDLTRSQANEARAKAAGGGGLDATDQRRMMEDYFESIRGFDKMVPTDAQLRDMATKALLNGAPPPDFLASQLGMTPEQLLANPQSKTTYMNALGLTHGYGGKFAIKDPAIAGAAITKLAASMGATFRASSQAARDQWYTQYRQAYATIGMDPAAYGLVPTGPPTPTPVDPFESLFTPDELDQIRREAGVIPDSLGEGY